MPKGQHPIVGKKQNKYLLNLHSIKKERMNQSWYLKNLKQCPGYHNKTNYQFD